MNENNFAVKALVKNNDKILLLQKTEMEAAWDCEENRFDLPGGRVLHNESFVEALKREIKEEIGLSVYDIEESFRKTLTKANGEVLNFIYYECFADDINVILSDEHENYFWKSTEEILKDNALPQWIKELVKK